MKTRLLIILISFVLWACYDTEEHLKEMSKDLLPKIQINPQDSVLANGADIVEIKVIFPLQSDRDLVKVNFTTDEGIFLENGDAKYTSTEVYRAGEELYISAKLKTTTTKGSHNLKVEVPGVYEQKRPITFLPSYPVSIKAGKNKFAVTRTFTDEIQLAANLSAEKGYPHKGTTVKFVVADSLSSDNSDLFRSLSATDANGQATVLFTPGNFGSYTGTVSYKVITATATGEEISDTGTFQVIAPE